MSKLSEPFRCAPKGWRESGQQKDLFKPWPADRLEPAGNPAYEGYGYPAAGYGQRRNTVVGLKYPKVENPQLVGWEKPQPVGQRIHPMGTLNPRSDQYARSEIAPLMGLGCSCQTDRTMKGLLGGLGAVQMSPEQAAMQKEKNSLQESLMRGVVPDSIANKLFDKIVADEAANNDAWNVLQKLKAISPSDPKLAELQKAQEKAWGETNTAKFYAMFLPPVRDRLAERIKAKKMSPPDYKYIRGGSTGIFSQAANFIREKFVGDSVRDFAKQGLIKDSVLAGLGEPITLGTAALVVAALLAAGIVAYIGSQAANVARDAIRAYSVKKCSEGAIDPASCKNLLTPPPGETDWTTIAKYAGIGLAALVGLQVIGSIRTAFPAR